MSSRGPGAWKPDGGAGREEEGVTALLPDPVAAAAAESLQVAPGFETRLTLGSLPLFSFLQGEKG